jgi:hypothetical protein
MTYGEVTRRIRFETSADRSISDELMIDVVHDAIREVALKCVPLVLISSSNAEQILRWKGDVNFIRVHK